MSRRIDPTWTVVESRENDQHDRCVDVFMRPDGSWGFEAFRRDPEDAGAWTPTHAHAFTRHPSHQAACTAAARLIPWFAEQPDTHPRRPGWNDRP